LETLLLEITKLRDGLRGLLEDWNKRLESSDNLAATQLLQKLTAGVVRAGLSPSSEIARDFSY
jgi:hypothetical protein